MKIPNNNKREIFKKDKFNLTFQKIKRKVQTFFIIPVLRLLKVVYRLNLFSINSILILTRPLVFFPGLRPWGFVTTEISPSESESSSIVEGSTFSIVNVGTPPPGAVGKAGWLICVPFIVFDKVSPVTNV